ncbi:MAG: LysM peptidoglycan-binding domain-containing protein [Verrucomicrobiales bacterium]|nr:LysM peptidoglycan-binding domain-containing protein [Verrucomicrobiales bacterium]
MRELHLAWLFVLVSLLATADLQATTHTIKKGDTLYSLSRTYGVSVNEITKANPGISASSLKVGQKVEIPDKADATPPPASDANSAQSGAVSPSSEVVDAPSTTPPSAVAQPAVETPKTYVVKKGDTLTSIAKQYSVTIGDLKNWNKLGSTQIRIGQKLKLSDDSAATPPVVQSGSTNVAGKPVDKPKTPPPTPSKGNDAVDTDIGKYLFVSKVKKQIDAPRISHIWKYIVVHHSGSDSGNAKIFDYYHRSRGMENGLAYHFVIGNGSDSGDGEIEVGGRWPKQLKGGHLRSDEQNEVAIGICLVGNFDKDRPTRKQIAALIELVNYLNRRVTTAGYPRPKFVLHRDINIRPTDCPGKNFPAAAMYKMFGAWKGE